MTLERATTKDIPLILEIGENVSNNKTYSFNTEEEWRDELKTCVVYIVKENESNVGYVSYEKKPDGSIYISDLVIRPAFQGRGFAREAMEIILEELNGAEKIYLVTHPDNIASVNLYKSLGFTEGKRKENYFGDGEPRIMMFLNKNPGK